MSYHADPGGVFDSDTHRRVLAHLPLPGDAPIAAYDDSGSERDNRRASLYHRMVPDIGTDLEDEAEVVSVLEDLEADGYAAKTKDGWKQTKKGQEALSAPVPGSED
jgi:hypothetical protein